VVGRVPEHIIQQIARGVDFVRLAGRYLDLKKRGKSYWALCPFHKEKTPSFSIDPERGFYHCFGCKEGGNVFSFLQKMEGLTFREALEKLAREAGIDLSQYRGAAAPSAGEFSRLRQALELAASFYQKCLEKARGSQRAREYIDKRSFTPESVERWRLGYAPTGWDNFLKCALGRDFKPEVLVKAGLVRARQGAPGHYDWFRNRLIFPIGDATGRPIAFGARALDPEDEPKYLNSPEGPLFSKGRCFFGLSQAKAALRSADKAVILEGYTDVIMAHQAGVNEAVAVLGTALTEEHARRIGRLCGEVILVFDPDEAGQKSAARSVEVLLNEGLQVRVAQLPSGLDPCDYIVERGGEAFRRELDGSLDFFEFRLKVARESHDISTVQGRAAAFEEVADFAVALRDPVRREMVVRQVADELRVRPQAVWRRLEQKAGRRWREPGEPARTEPEKLVADKSIPGELLGLTLAYPELCAEAVDGIDPSVLVEGPEKDLLIKALGEFKEKGSMAPKDFVNSLTDPELAGAASRAMAEEQRRQQIKSIRERTAQERLQGYLEYLRQKELSLSAAQSPPEELGDEALKELERKLIEKDKRSARSK